MSKWYLSISITSGLDRVGMLKLHIILLCLHIAHVNLSIFLIFSNAAEFPDFHGVSLRNLYVIQQMDNAEAKDI